MGSYTNQQFVILSKEQEEKLSQKYIFELDGVLPDGRSVVRFCTSWSTTDKEVNELVQDGRCSRKTGDWHNGRVIVFAERRL